MVPEGRLAVPEGKLEIVAGSPGLPRKRMEKRGVNYHPCNSFFIIISISMILFCLIYLWGDCSSWLGYFLKYFSRDIVGNLMFCHSVGTILPQGNYCLCSTRGPSNQ